MDYDKATNLLADLYDLTEDAEEREALRVAEKACHAMASISETLQSIGRLDNSEDAEAILTSLDGLNNELSAAIVFLAGLDVDVASVLESMAASYKRHATDEDLGNALHTAYVALSRKVANVKSVAEAQKQNQIFQKNS